jgi:outer membrane protein TolC
MRKLFSTILISFFVSPALLFPQEILSLKACINIGLENNYQIRISKNDQQISDNNTTIGNSGYLPTLDLNAGYNGTLNNIAQFPETGGEPIKNTNVLNQGLNAGINLNWTVFEGFSIKTNYDKLKELQQIGKLNTRISIENLISSISAEYYNYVQQNIRLRNLQSAVNLSKERLRIVEARYNIGSASKLDYQQAKVDFNSDSSKLIQQQELLFSSLVNLNQIMVLDNMETQFEVSDTIILMDILQKKEDLLNLALNNNVFLLLSQKEKELSLLDLRTAKSQNLPYLKVNAGYGYNQNMYGIGTYKQQNNLGFNYGITLGYNLFNGFNRTRTQENAKIQIESKQLEHMEIELSVKSDFANAWMAYQNNMRLKDLEKENIETARDNFDIAMDRYKLGDLSGIELREAQNSLLEAEQRLVQAQYNTKLCEISLMQICGKITNYLD